MGRVKWRNTHPARHVAPVHSSSRHLHRHLLLLLLLPLALCVKLNQKRNQNAAIIYQSPPPLLQPSSKTFGLVDDFLPGPPPCPWMTP
jgi:hypothetical protein